MSLTCRFHHITLYIYMYHTDHFFMWILIKWVFFKLLSLILYTLLNTLTQQTFQSACEIAESSMAQMLSIFNKTCVTGDTHWASDA